MKNKIPHVYVASGWFNPADKNILTRMEEYVEYLRDKGLCTIHRPRVDGVELKPGEFHDPELRKKVFTDNVVNIDKADIVYANLSTNSASRLDTGTVWEVAYAIEKGKIVLILDRDVDFCVTLFDTFKGLLHRQNVFVTKTHDDSEDLLRAFIDAYINNFPWIKDANSVETYDNLCSDPMILVRPDSNTKINEIYIEVYKVSEGKNDSVLSMEDMLAEINHHAYLVVDTTVRESFLVFLMGVAYARNIPVVSYSDDDKSVNLMLVCSVVYHAVGEELKSVLENIRDNGIDNVKFDNANLKVY